MTSSTKTTPPSIREIKRLMKEDKWKKIHDYDNRNFGENLSGEWLLTAFVQVRSEEYDRDHVDLIRSQYDENELEPKIAIKFNNEVYDEDEDGEEVLVARQGELLIGGGTHTWFAEVEEGTYISPKGIFLVDFEKDLGGHLGKLKALCSSHNNRRKVTKSYDKSDVKEVVYQYMNDNKDIYGVHKLTKENYEEILELFPIVSRETIKNWVGSHPVTGGRRKPLKKYTKKQRKQIYETLENLYGKTHEVLEVRELRSWDVTAVSTMNKLAFEMDMNRYPNKPQFYVAFYCSTVKQAQDLPDIKKKIKDYYKNWLEKKLGRSITVKYLAHK